ncbi:DNA primase [Thermoplasma sp. Kam2015]|uniref:DNA primase DnaG n=1 Tax=Thermoplasma sp. Kam2015 TaxID=2094122 RepID=UPI000D831E2F|nr:DNA primase DnaG [Thermoplasma sp. Kam2015]PYB69117.1 DNA primase [Thermoplasma sp. Kam2015]
MNVDPNLTKYMIKAKIYTDGVVEKPDVVGAIFGQTEGLLGDDLDLRDLQKSGKIGRIEVEIDSKKGRTEGYALIPSGLDQVETAILAAALETIDRIGPCKARVEIANVEDVRVQKRQKIIERAKKIYQEMNSKGDDLSESLVKSVREEVEKSEIISYGEEKLPAGPAINDSDSIIVVEGRNDVLNLLKYGIKNTIAVQGTNIPDTVKKLSKERTVTVFLDGDRGGDLILKEMLQVAEVDFVARAPPGTEVEELTYKQIVKALRYKTPIDQYLSMHGMNDELKEYSQRNNIVFGSQQNNNHEAKAEVVEEPQDQSPKVEEIHEEQSQQVTVQKEGFLDLLNPHEVSKRIEALAQLKMTEVYDSNGEKLFSFPVSEAVERISQDPKGNTVITGGVISQRLIDVSYNAGIKNIYGLKLGHITKKPVDINVIAWERSM